MPDYLYFEFLDVGMGECTLIKCGTQKILIDLGSTKSRKVAVPDALTYLENELAGPNPKLDLVVFTHPDQDHYNQFDKLVKAVPYLNIKEIWYGGRRDEYKVGKFYQYLKRMDANEFPNNCYSTKPFWKSTNKDLSIYLLACNYPDRDFKDTNPKSIVLMFKWNGWKILMTGDATDATEEAILKRFNAPGQLSTDVLKVPHHGSDTSSSEKFIKATLPDVIVVSADNNPGYKLPLLSVIKMYEGHLTGAGAHSTVVYDDDSMFPDFVNRISKKNLYTTLETLNQGVQWEFRFSDDGKFNVKKTE